MILSSPKSVALVTVCLLVTAQETLAWGPRAQKAITAASIQLIRREFSDAFRAGSSNYEADVFRGAEDGYKFIASEVPLNSDAQSLEAVFQQIQLLREVRKEGLGGYFAYRVGVLSSLASEVVLPFGVVYTKEREPLKQKVDADLDAHVGQLTLNVNQDKYVYIRQPQEYFKSKRIFYPADQSMIEDDYKRGRGFSGSLDQAAQAYFDRSVEAVGDSWFSVFRAQDGDTDVKPSPQIVKDYFVNEIAYSLEVRKNYLQANRAYRIFEEVNPGDVAAYDRIGDMYYAFGTQDAKDRGVKEWKIAQQKPGPQRNRASWKISKHYMETGDTYARRAKGPDATDTDLEEALRAFQQALEYNQSDQTAADRINETTKEIALRRERRETQQKIVDGVLKVIQEAESLKVKEEYEVALTNYNKASGLLEAVSDEFRDLKATAEKTDSDIKKAVRDITETIMNNAQAAIDRGVDLVAQVDFDNAISEFESVPGFLDALPAGDGATLLQRSDELRAQAEAHIVETKQTQQRYVDDQAAKQGGLPKPAAPPPGAKP